MLKKLILTLSLALSACSISISSNEVSPTPFFLTATLPLTSTPLPRPPTPSPTAATPTVNAALAACKERAVVIQDVTIPDNTYVAAGASFTKTWRFENTGTCPWTGYTIAFASGDRMGAPDSVPVPSTAAGATVDVSVPLTAPTASNAYAGYFVLNDQSGKSIPIGIYKNFWVKIIVGSAPITPPALAVVTPSTSRPANQPTSPAGCKYTFSASYVGQIENLINTARGQAGLNKLSINQRLTAAAQGHSEDMACHSLLSHTGSDASTIYQRMVAAGYNPVNYLEIIYASGYPQDAYNWWMNDPVHHDAILNSGVTEMGGGYAYVSTSAYGGYYTVDFGSQ
ncbi:MAG TPA: NBR1-Ig-like domain-containing protein [Anaerolineales bacterium]|nr:NBR1-Ig-like domain-containing protein [Anaerolineales bacterium]